MSENVMAMSGWERWHDWQARMLEPVTAWYLEATGAAPGLAILDAACGTGLPALALAERVAPGGKVIATDVSDVMLAAVARKAAASGLGTLEVRCASVTSLGVPDGGMDAVSCKDGLMYCDPVEGARELRRVLRPGGRFAISAWDELARNPFFATMFGVVGRFFPGSAPPPDAPGPLRLAGPGVLERVLHEAGFDDVTVTRVEGAWELDSLEMHWDVVSSMAAPVQKAAATLPAGELARFRDALGEALAPYADGDRIRLPYAARCATGAR